MEGARWKRRAICSSTEAEEEHLEVEVSPERRAEGAGGVSQPSGHQQASEHRQLAPLEQAYDVETWNTGRVSEHHCRSVQRRPTVCTTHRYQASDDQICCTQNQRDLTTRDEAHITSVTCWTSVRITATERRIAHAYFIQLQHCKRLSWRYILGYLFFWSCTKVCARKKSEKGEGIKLARHVE